MLFQNRGGTYTWPLDTGLNQIWKPINGILLFEISLISRYWWSTGLYIVFYKGGPIDHDTHVTS